MRYADYQHNAQPSYRLVLEEGVPFPAATSAGQWQLLGVREAEMVGADARDQIAAQGHSLFRVHVSLSDVDQ